MKHSGPDDAPRCSFCHKSQDVVEKVISAPSDYPRAYISDECIAVCCSILKDDKSEPPPPTADDSANQQRIKAHALVEEVPPERLEILIERILELFKDRAN